MVRGAPFPSLADQIHGIKFVCPVCTADWLMVRVKDRPITAEDTSEQISDLKNKLSCNWLLHIYMLVPQDPYEEFER